MKFCVGKQFFAEFRQWDRYPHSAEHISCFPNAVLASASGAFHIVSNTLLLLLLLLLLFITTTNCFYIST